MSKAKASGDDKMQLLLRIWEKNAVEQFDGSRKAIDQETKEVEKILLKAKKIDVRTTLQKLQDDNAPIHRIQEERTRLLLGYAKVDYNKIRESFSGDNGHHWLPKDDHQHWQPETVIAGLLDALKKPRNAKLLLDFLTDASGPGGK